MPSRQTDLMLPKTTYTNLHIDKMYAWRIEKTYRFQSLVSIGACWPVIANWVGQFVTFAVSSRATHLITKTRVTLTSFLNILIIHTSFTVQSIYAQSYYAKCNYIILDNSWQTLPTFELNNSLLVNPLQSQDNEEMAEEVTPHTYKTDVT